MKSTARPPEDELPWLPILLSTSHQQKISSDNADTLAEWGINHISDFLLSALNGSDSALTVDDIISCHYFIILYSTRLPLLLYFSSYTLGQFQLR